MDRLWRSLSRYHDKICATYAVGSYGDPFWGAYNSSFLLFIVIFLYIFFRSESSAKSADSSTLFSPTEMHERFDYRGASSSKSLGGS